MNGLMNSYLELTTETLPNGMLHNIQPPLTLAVRGGWVVPSHCPHPYWTQFQPHEQLLMVVVGGAVMVVVLRCHLLSLSSSLSVVVVVMLSFHPLSTPQAVACEAGGR